MKGALATVRLIFTGIRLQRWLLGLGLAAQAVSAVALLGATHSWWPPVLLISGCFLMLMAPVVLNGILLRQIASQRMTQLAPGARRQLLLGTLLNLVLIAFGVMLVAALLMTHGLPHPFHGGDLLSRTTAIFAAALFTATAVCFCLYYGGRFRFGFLALPILVMLARALAPLTTGIQPLLPAFFTPPASTLMLASSLASWILFAAAFLRARRIAPMAWGHTGQAPVSNVRFLRPPASAAHPAPADPAPVFTQKQALRILLTGVYAGGRAGLIRLLLRITLFYGVLFALLALASSGSGAHADNTGFLSSIIGTVSVLIIFATAASMTRRARYLWLKTGCDRRQLFLTVEALCWRMMLGVSVIMMAITGLLCLLQGTSALMLAQVGLMALIPGTVLLYLKLLTIQGWRLPDTLASSAYGLLWLAAFILSMGGALTPIQLSLLAAQILLIPMFRFWARARWDRIDWRRNMPLQILHRPPF